MRGMKKKISQKRGIKNAMGESSISKPISHTET